METGLTQGFAGIGVNEYPYHLEVEVGYLYHNYPELLIQESWAVFGDLSKSLTLNLVASKQLLLRSPRLLLVYLLVLKELWESGSS